MLKNPKRVTLLASISENPVPLCEIAIVWKHIGRIRDMTENSMLCFWPEETSSRKLFWKKVLIESNHMRNWCNECEDKGKVVAMTATEFAVNKYRIATSELISTHFAEFSASIMPCYNSIVKNSSADLGVNSKIVQIRPTVKSVCTKMSKNFFCIFVNIWYFWMKVERTILNILNI